MIIVIGPIRDLLVLWLLALGKPQAVISEETAKEAEGNGDARHTVRNGSTKSNGGNHSKKLFKS